MNEVANATPLTVLYRPDQPTEPAVADDFAEHYGHLPVMLAETAQILANYLTGDERSWDAEEADLDLSETIESVQQYGVVNPITLGTDGRVLDGHHRLLAARRLGIGQVPVRLAIMPTEPTRVGRECIRRPRPAEPLHLRCPNCGHLVDLHVGSAVCPVCRLEALAEELGGLLARYDQGGQ